MPWAFGGTRMALDHSLTHSLTHSILINLLIQVNLNTLLLPRGGTLGISGWGCAAGPWNP